MKGFRLPLPRTFEVLEVKNNMEKAISTLFNLGGALNLLQGLNLYRSAGVANIDIGVKSVNINSSAFFNFYYSLNQGIRVPVVSTGNTVSGTGLGVPQLKNVAKEIVQNSDLAMQEAQLKLKLEQERLLAEAEQLEKLFADLQKYAENGDEDSTYNVFNLLMSKMSWAVELNISNLAQGLLTMKTALNIVSEHVDLNMKETIDHWCQQAQEAYDELLTTKTRCWGWEKGLSFKLSVRSFLTEKEYVGKIKTSFVVKSLIAQAKERKVNMEKLEQKQQKKVQRFMDYSQNNMN